jgi:hypothetical protein
MAKRINFLKSNWALICINLFLIYYIINEGIISPGGEDLRSSLGSSLALQNSESLYFSDFPIGRGDETMKYAYTPFWSMILIPFVYAFNQQVLVFLWLILSLIFINRILFICCQILMPNNKNIFYLISFLLVSRFVMHNLDVAQMTIFWVYTMVEAYYQCEIQRKFYNPAILIAIGASIKFMPLLMFYYWFIRGRWKSLYVSSLLIILFTCSPFIFFDYYYTSVQFQNCWSVINPLQTGFNFNLIDHATQGIPSILAFYIPLFNIEVNEVQINLIISAIRILFLVWIAVIYKTVFKVESSKSSFILFGLCCLGASLLMPHQQHYSFFSSIIIFTFFASILSISWISQNKSAAFIFFISVFLMTFTLDIFIGNNLKQQCKTYKTIGIGAILLVLSLHLSLWKNINNSKSLRQT